MKLYYCVIAVALTASSSYTGFSDAAETDKETIARVLRDWTTRRERSRIVQYLVEGEITIPKGALNGISSILNMGGGDIQESPSEDSPPEDSTYSSSRSYLLDFKQGLFRREHDEMIWEADLRVFNRTKMVTVFDGTSVKSYEPNSENTRAHYDIVENTPEFNFREKTQMRPDSHDSAIFFGHGVPLLSGDIVKDIRGSINSSMLHVRRRRDDLVVLRSGTTERYSEFEVDLARESAIVAASYVIDSHTTWNLAIEYSPLDGSWLPKHWRTNSFDPDGTPTRTANFDVKAVDTNVDESVSPVQFQLVPATNDVVLTNEGHFRVDASGEFVRIDPRVPRNRGLPWVVCGLAVGGGVLVALGLIAMRRKKTIATD